jgi:hypothetical protein
MDNVGEIWERLLGKLEVSQWRNDALWNFAADVCSTVAAAFQDELSAIPSPFDDVPQDVKAVVAAMEDHIAQLSPPSAVLCERGRWTDSRGFWAICYAAWQFRLDEERFERFKRDYGWREKPAAAEEALGNVVLQSFRALELKSGWANFRRGEGGDPPDAEQIKPAGAVSAVGAMSRSQAVSRMGPGVPWTERLVIEPNFGIASDKLSTAASVDFHLGSRFTVLYRRRDVVHDPLEGHVATEEYFVPHGDSFVLLPGQLVLGTTLEWFCFPLDLMAFWKIYLGAERLGDRYCNGSAPGLDRDDYARAGESGGDSGETEAGRPNWAAVFSSG